MKGGNFCILSTTCLNNFGSFAFISLQNTRFLSFLTLLNDSPTKEKPAASVMTLIVTLKFILLLKRYGQFLKNMNFIIWTLLNGKCDGEFKCKISTRLGVETPVKIGSALYNVAIKKKEI